VTAVVANTGWVLEADPGPSVASAAARGRAEVLQFRRTFGFTAAAVFLAAAAVVWILFQMDRLARQRARFAAAAAHELKTPLAGLLLHSEMLAEDLGDPEHRRSYAATVTSEAERLGRVVSNMLDLARLERGALRADARPGDLGAAVDQCIVRSRRRLEDAGLNLEVSISSTLPPALFDDDALCQILDNLLDNAEKHTRRAAERRVEVRVTAGDDALSVEVSDNGPGIPRHQRRSLFRPFDRPAGADGASGLGLGLAVARSFARAQGGDLKLADTHDQGATFMLTLPRA
jgi:two-component system sensor histidine kinase KdpD